LVLKNKANIWEGKAIRKEMMIRESGRDELINESIKING